ncbi:MAG: lipid A export permease/ATP-binding protein MsbA [Proteobacteria bacterium]|nr:lipid A export permease/ATP-binding protein MsbA [Candidatus Fonsibacter sp. PEL5]
MNSKNHTKLTIFALYKKLARYALTYKYILFLSIFFTIVVAFTNTSFLAVIKKITDHGFLNQDSYKRFSLALILLITMVVRALGGLISNYSLKWISMKTVEDLRCDAFKKIMNFPISYFDKNPSSFIVSKITNETAQLSGIVTEITYAIMKDGLTVIGIICYMVYLDWKLTLIFLLLVPLIIIYISYIAPRLRKAGQSIQEEASQMLMVSDEAISSQRIVKIFDTKQYEISKFSKVARRIRQMYSKLARLYALNSFFVEIFAAISLAAIAYYSFGVFTPGQFAAFFGALLMVIGPIKNITAVNDKTQVAIAAAESLFSMMDQKIEDDKGVKSLEKVEGKIVFKNVFFRYENSKNDSLKFINLTIRPGEKIALVGKSGSGKTTLLNLIPRFYSPAKGEIFLDDIEVNKLSLKNLRSHFSLVTQDTILFNDTIFNNIVYGDLRKKWSKKDVIKAAIAANAWEFIELLPNKLDHQIGDRGVRLSGGQRQRIAIARAILKNAPILLLDEATSALDPHSEKYVQAALDNLMKNRTSIVIAHRLSTVLNADRIIVMEKSEIVDSGTHQELMKRCRYYSLLYKKGLK